MGAHLQFPYCVTRAHVSGVQWVVIGLLVYWFVGGDVTRVHLTL